MLKAALKLILLSGTFLILTLFAVFFVRWMGFQQTFAPPPHPWFSQKFWSIYTPTPEEICAATPNLDKLVPDKNWIIDLPLKFQNDNWVIPCSTPLALEVLLKRDPHADYVFNLEAHEMGGLDKLVQIASPFEKTKHFGLHSDSQKAALYLRKKAPQWLFAADTSTLTRLRVFESLWIESALDFWPDFVIAGFSPHDPLQIDERMARELERRKKRLVWNQEVNASEEPHIPFQGIMTNRPSEADAKLKK